MAVGVRVCATEAMEEAEGEGADEERSYEELGVNPSPAGGHEGGGAAEGRGDVVWEKVKEVKKWDCGGWERMASSALLAQTSRLILKFILLP